MVGYACLYLKGNTYDTPDRNNICCYSAVAQPANHSRSYRCYSCSRDTSLRRKKSFYAIYELLP